MPAARDLLAAVAAGGLVTYSVSDGNGGHILLQVALLLAGAVLVFEHLLELGDDGS